MNSRNNRLAFLMPKSRMSLGVTSGLVTLAALALLCQTVSAQTNRKASEGSSSNSSTDQNAKGSITGYVTDAAGGVLQGASVPFSQAGSPLYRTLRVNSLLPICQRETTQWP
jgi:hypothetical protein